MERLKEICNGERVVPTFSAQEMERRVGLLRKAMAEHDVDAVVFTPYHNINYYSDFLYTSFGRPYGLVVTADDQTSISANIDGGMPWRRTYERTSSTPGLNQVITPWTTLGLTCDLYRSDLRL